LNAGAQIAIASVTGQRSGRYKQYGSVLKDGFVAPKNTADLDKMPCLSFVDVQQDLNSIAHLIIMRGLVNSFELEAIYQKRHAGFLLKSDRINKMHLRRAGIVS
jgi:hypothetical protein